MLKIKYTYSLPYYYYLIIIHDYTFVIFKYRSTLLGRRYLCRCLTSVQVYVARAILYWHACIFMCLRTRRMRYLVNREIIRVFSLGGLFSLRCSWQPIETGKRAPSPTPIIHCPSLITIDVPSC